MPVWRACLILAVSGTVASASPVSLQLSAALGWNSGVLQRCELRAGDFRFALAGRSGFLPVESGPEILVGLSSPWLRAGPLSPAGSLREACNPLGFLAGSDVFVQRTGFVLDESFPAQPSGIFLMPLARSLGVFYRPLAGGGEWFGCMASVFHRPGIGAEGFLSLSDPPARSAGEEWINLHAPFAGGRILTAAARLLVETGPFGIGATVGASRGEISPPGSFCHLHAAARAGILRFYFLMGCADAGYLTPSGEPSAEARVASAALLLSDSHGSIDIRASRVVDQSSFAVHSFLASRSEASFKIETTLPAAGEALLLARVEGGTIIHRDVEGGGDPASRFFAAIGARASPLRLEVGAACASTEGISTLVTAEASLDHRGSRAGFEGRLLHLDTDARAFSTGFSFRLERPDLHIAFSAGLDELSFCAPARDLPHGIRLSLEWKTREVSEWGSPSP